jgi:hypothetical protein
MSRPMFDPESYLMTARGKEGFPIRPLPFPAEPGPVLGESVLSVACGAAAWNGFDSMYRVLRLADIDTLRTETLPTVHTDAAARLAYVLRLPDHEIASRMHPKVERPGSRQGSSISSGFLFAPPIGKAATGACRRARWRSRLITAPSGTCCRCRSARKAGRR